MAIPVFLPTLPSVHELIPYLKEIESSQIYSNFGPLVFKLHQRLAEYFGVSECQVTTLSNATLALEGAVQTSSLPNTKWISPSWTFAATNLAIKRSGVEFSFGDVDSDWRLLPENPSSFILDVCPFGAPLDLSRFGITDTPTLVDAAASFPALEGCGSQINSCTNPVGIVVSFHPTKILPGIEGGVFISNRTEWVEQVRSWSRFGMEKGSRSSKNIGTNAKMSEYQAAVIMASLQKYISLKDSWFEKHRSAQQIAQSVGVKNHPSMIQESLSTYWVIESEPHNINLIERDSVNAGFHTKRWWEYGCHRMPVFENIGHRGLENTNRISNSTIGLPFHLKLNSQDFELIHSTLSLVLSRG